MSRALLAAAVLLVGCGGDASLSREEADDRADAVIREALSSGELVARLAPSESADESMNRQGGAAVGEVRMQLRRGNLTERDGSWVAAYDVVGNTSRVCVYVSEESSRLAVRRSC